LPFEEPVYSFVARAVGTDGRDVILKLGMPRGDVNPELLTEIEALLRFNGRGCVRLIAVDRDLGALLLERADPGTTLATVPDDEQATYVAAGVMRRLWRPVEPNHPFPTVHRWAQGFTRMRERYCGGCGPLPQGLVDKAERTYSELLASGAEPVLLHGDLHHWNILSSHREPWLAIDPKGVVGEPAYEVGALLRNMTDPLLRGPHPVEVVRKRVGVLSEELGFERDRILGWGLAQAILSAWWDIEDGTGDGGRAVHLAQLIDAATS
jgi:streptomycin 6-kinase